MFATLSRTWTAVLFDIEGTILDTTPGAPVAVVPGIEGVLQSLAEQGIPLAIATIKTESEALELLEQSGLRQYFSVISANDAGESGKEAIIAKALAELEANGADLSMPVLVGDRIHDVDGASANGIPSIIVEWGHGSPDEAGDAIATVFSADKLRELLLGN
jgi:phosphoglycolate phosphatase